MGKQKTPHARVGINTSYNDWLKKHGSQGQILIDKFSKIFSEKGADYIRKRCIDEIADIRNASGEKRKKVLNRIVHQVYDNWLAQLTDILEININNESEDKVNIPETVEEVKGKIDELLPNVDRRFKKEKSEKGRESEPQTNNKGINEIEDLYTSLPNAKQITKLYLYALYYKYQKDISYVDALNKANGIIRIDKDIIDLQNNFKTWRDSKKGKDLVSKVIEIVTNKK